MQYVLLSKHTKFTRSTPLASTWALTVSTGDAGGSVGWKAINAGTDRGEGDGADLVLGCQFKTAAVAGGEFLVFVVVSSAPDGPDGVKDPLGRKAEAGSSFGFTGSAAIQIAAGVEQFGAGGAMDGAVDTAAAEQRGVGRVDDDIDVQCGDVAGDGDELGHGVLPR